ncbi:MAG: hypothetical protein GX111_09235 [Clostridiales bacterium]|nr:hypothetical protein [Clostridiales bacterium]
MGKFDHLFHEFVPQETNWGDWCHSPQAYFRGDSDIPGANMSCGFQVFKAPVFLEREPHFHREEEYLVFLGAKLPDVFSSFDAEIEFFMGPTLDEMEKIVITKPTIIRIPKCMWHSPLDFKRMTKPVLFQAVAMHGKFGSIKLRQDNNGRNQYIYTGDEARPCVFDASKTCDYCGKCFDRDATLDNREAIEPYWTVKDSPLSDAIKALICELPAENTKWGDWCPTPQAYFRGETYLPGANYHVGFQVFTGELDMEDSHFHQGADEYIFFMGADPMNIFDFDCEITFNIGDDPDHMEQHIITKPTVVMLPPTVWHSPFLFRKMKKPVLFQAAFQAGCWGTIVREKNEKGEWIYTYRGDNVRYCRHRPGEKCTLCGKCFSIKAGDDLAK